MRLKYCSIILIIIAICTISCKKDDGVRPQSKAFVKLYGGVADQQAWDLTEIAEGTRTKGYIIVGSSNSFNPLANITNNEDDKNTPGGHDQMYIVKTDEEGNMTHSIVIGNTNSEAKSVIIDDKGDVVVLGNSQRVGQKKLMIAKLQLADLSIIDTLTLKTDDSGNSETASQIIEAKGNDGYLIVGTTTKVDPQKEQSNYDPERDRTDVILLKVDPVLTNIIWERTHGFKGEDQGSSVHPTTDGYAVLADSDNLNNQDLSVNNIFLFLTSDRGIPTHNAVFGRKDSDRAQTFRELPSDGSFVVTGISGEKSAYLYTLDKDLVVEDTPENLLTIGEQMLSIDTSIQNPSKYVILGTRDQKFALIPPSGDINTPVIYGGQGDNIAAKVISLQSGGFAFCGTVAFEGNQMMGLVRVDEEGKFK